MNPEKVRLAILRDAHGRRGRGEPILRTPHQYSEELGFPEKEVKLAFEYLIDGRLMDGTAEMLRTGLVIYQVTSLTAKGAEAVERTTPAEDAPGGGAGGALTAAEIYSATIRLIEGSGAGAGEKAEAKSLMEYAKAAAPEFLPGVAEAVKKRLRLS